MSWRTVCITRRAKLELRMGALVIRGEDITRIHLSEIGVLIVESTAVSLTASLLAELVRQKIKVIFCDEQHNPLSELLPYHGCHDSSAAIRRQMGWDPTEKTAVWTEIIRQKIKNQAALLTQFHMSEADLLNLYITQLQPDDLSNREGHAAKVYFKALFGLSFCRDVINPINAALDYGYTLLLSLFNRELSACGCLTQLGIGHCSTFNHFNLSSDLMEPFRPFIDREVYQMSQVMVDFGTDEKYRLIRLLEADVQVNRNTYKLNYAARIFVQNVVRYLNQDQSKGIAEIAFVG